MLRLQVILWVISVKTRIRRNVLRCLKTIHGTEAAIAAGRKNGVLAFAFRIRVSAPAFEVASVVVVADPQIVRPRWRNPHVFLRVVAIALSAFAMRSPPPPPPPRPQDRDQKERHRDRSGGSHDDDSDVVVVVVVSIRLGGRRIGRLDGGRCVFVSTEGGWTVFIGGGCRRKGRRRKLCRRGSGGVFVLDVGRRERRRYGYNRRSRR
mmetsp:Transcript_19485/g.38216  ORF Transcript_19485/g.38216 Transcript_19485/m.38216 type:complete len:207 (+) Transcript_19485:1435-2055(+)